MYISYNEWACAPTSRYDFAYRTSSKDPYGRTENTASSNKNSSRSSFFPTKEHLRDRTKDLQSQVATLKDQYAESAHKVKKLEERLRRYDELLRGICNDVAELRQKKSGGENSQSKSKNKDTGKTKQKFTKATKQNVYPSRVEAYYERRGVHFGW